ncbi:25048_t:CDS:2, partial [Racocetra persica]
LPLFAVGIIGVLSSLVPCSHWCLVIAGVVVGIVVIAGVVVVIGLGGLAYIPTFLWDFSGILVNLRVSPAFLWNGFAFFSGILISSYVRFFTVDL